MKTLAVRLEDEQHARLSLLARLTGSTVADIIRDSVEERLAALANDPDLAAKAKALVEEIDREAAEQRDALASLLATGKPSPRAAKG